MTFDFVTYMRNIAINLKAIQHVEDDEKNKAFYRVSSLSKLDELLQNLTGMKLPAIMVNDQKPYRMLVNEGDNSFKRYSFLFYVILSVDSDDFDAKEAAYKQAEEIMDSIFSKMKRDRMNDKKFIKPDTGMGNIELNSIMSEDFGPIGDNCHGAYCQFSMLVPCNKELVYNEVDWVS